MQHAKWTGLLTAILFFLTACDYLPFGYTAIGDIHQSPGRFEGSEVKIKGTVTDISKLPLLEIKTFTVRDNSGEIVVVTEQTLPAIHDFIAIRATVKTTAIIGGQTFGLRLHEMERLPLPRVFR